MEPERPIEKLLRDAGKKRASGQSVEIHPATRKMLQAEVGRQFGGSKSNPQTGSLPGLIAQWWPRVGWSFGVLLGVAVAALLMIPRERPTSQMMLAQSKAPLEMNGRDKAKSSGWADASSSAEKNQPVRKDGATDSATPAKRLQPAAPAVATLNESRAREVEHDRERPSAAAAPPQPTVAFGGQPASRELSADTSVSLAPTVAPTQPVAPPTPPQSDASYFAGTATRDDSGRGVASLGQRFKQDALGDERKLADKDASKPVLLTSFAFELNGSQVRIVDADGSIYSGNVELSGATEGGLLKTENSLKAKNPGLSGGSRRLESAPAGVVAQKQSAGSEYYFRVIGTNRSLNAKVDFSGAITGATNAVSLADTKEPVNGPATARATAGAMGGQKLNLQQAQISGKALVGDKQQLDVKARAVKP